jgi:hypothetical protein
MSGLAACIRHNRPRTRPIVASKAKCRTDLGSARVAPACLMAPGPGLTFPRLNGIPVNHRLWCGEQAAARAAAAFLRAGIAAPEDWDIAQRNPIDFLKCSLDRWVGAHGAAEIAEELRLNLSLSTLDQHSSGDQQLGAEPDLYLIVEPDIAGYVVLGPTLRLLEKVHPQLPVTFAHLFLGALNRWVRVYDWRDAIERVDRLGEWYEMDTQEAAEAVDLPNIEREIPRCMKRKPMSAALLHRLRQSTNNPTAKVLIESVLALEAASAHHVPGPALDADTGEKFIDCGEPLPTLLVVFEKHDAIEGQFDEESEGMLELTPEPNLVMCLGTPDAASVQRGFDSLATCCQTLRLAVRLMKLIATI